MPKPAAARPAPPPEIKRFAPEKDGDIAWRFPPTGHSAAPAVRNCPAVDAGSGRIFAALGSSLVAIVEKDGLARALWEFRTGGHIPGSPVLGPDHRIRVHAVDGKVYFVTLEGEEALAPVEIEEPLGWASPIVDDDGNTWICGWSGGLYRIDAEGQRRREPFFRSRQKFDCTGLIHKGVFYVGAEDGFVYGVAISGMRGRITWDHLAGQGKTDWFINSALALSLEEPALIVAGRDEYLYAFHLNGKRLWKIHIRGQMLGSPVVDAAGNVYVGASVTKLSGRGEGRLVCVGDEPHRVRWEYKARGAVESTPVIGEDGIVYFGDNSGCIHAVDAEGNRVWIADVGSAVRSAGTIPCQRRVVFGLDNGTLVGLQCSSARLMPHAWPKYMANLGQSGGPSL